MSASDSAEGRGRMVHAMTAAKELQEAGEDVKVLFEGIGVTWLTAFHTKDHPFTQNYAPVFDGIKDNIMGACNFCTTGRFEAADGAEALGVPLLGEDGGHFSIGNLIADGYQIINY